MEIEHTGNLLSILDANRETRVVFTDGRTVNNGLGSSTVASFQNESLVIQTRGERSLMVQTYQLMAGGTRLRVHTELEGGRLPAIEVRTVYERVDAEGVLPVTTPTAADRNAWSRARVTDSLGRKERNGLETERRRSALDRRSWQ